MVQLFMLLFFAGITPQQSNPIDQAKKLFDAKRFAEAKKVLSAVDDDQKEYAAAQFYLGRISYEEEKYEDAAEYFEEAVEVNDKNAEYFTWLGDTYGTIAKDANVMRQGMLAPKMKSAWESAIALDPTSINPRLSLIQYYTQAPGFMGGSYEKAHEVARQIKKLNLAQGHRAEGNVFYSEEKWTEAEREYVAMVKADAAYTPVLANYYVNRKQYDRAFSLFEETLKQNPTDMSTAYQFGRLSAISGQRLDAGEVYLKKYLGYKPQPNEPSHAGAYMRLGNIYEKRGKKIEAKNAYESSLKLDETMKEAKEGLSRVK